MVDLFSDVLGLTIYMTFSPVIIILSLFVGASGLSLLRTISLGSGIGLVAGTITYPLLRLFATFDGRESGYSHLLAAAIAGALAGAAISSAMRSFSRRTSRTSRIEPQ